MRRPARRFRLPIVPLLLSALGTLFLLWLVRDYGFAAVLARLSQIQPGWLAVYAAIEIALFTGYTIRWRYLLRALDHDVPFGRLLNARLAGLSIGSLTPGAKLGGEPLRAYMVAKDGVRAGPAIASVVVDRGLELLANIVFAIAYCALFALRDRTAAGQVLLVVGASGLAFLVGLAMVLRRLKRGDGLVPRPFVAVVERLGGSKAAVGDTEHALRALVFQHRRLLAWCAVAALAMNALVFAEYAALFAAFAARPSAPELAGSLLGVGLAHALPVPASIGALEGAQAVVMHVAGGSSELGLVAAAVARVRDIVWTVPGLVCLALWTWRRRRVAASRPIVET